MGKKQKLAPFSFEESKNDVIGFLIKHLTNDVKDFGVANIFRLEFVAWGKKKLVILPFSLSPYSGPTGKGLPAGIRP